MTAQCPNCGKIHKKGGKHFTYVKGKHIDGFCSHECTDAYREKHDPPSKLGAGKGALGFIGKNLNLNGTLRDMEDNINNTGGGLFLDAGKGIAKLGGKAIGAGIAKAKAAAAEAEARKEAERQEQLAADGKQANAYLKQINACDITGAAAATAQSLSTLLSIIVWKASDYGYEIERGVRDAAGKKIMLGIQQLSSLGDTANAGLFQEKLDETSWGAAKKREAELKAKMDAMKAQAKETMIKGIDAVAGGLKNLFNKKKQ
jgi:hypothetical protein